jgi:hypothetical protein
MRNKPFIALFAIVISSGLVLGTAQAAKQRAGKTSASVAAEKLTEAEAHDLLFMREEEKLARDVYVSLYEKWGVRVFNNIPKSEQLHMDAILSLLNTYGLADPVLESGLFSDPDLQSLYDTLLANGQQSKLDALMVGALIEEVDIEDIELAILRTDKSDLISVYMNLIKGSENHLNAFVRNIEAITGTPYVAQKISQEKVDKILER